MNYDSRYRDADELLVPSHDYDAIGNVEVRSDTKEPYVVQRRAKYLLTTLPLPEPPTEQYMMKETDSYAVLAKSIFDDSQKWWVIAEANPHIRHPLDAKMGDVIYLP